MVSSAMTPKLRSAPDNLRGKNVLRCVDGPGWDGSSIVSSRIKGVVIRRSSLESLSVEFSANTLELRLFWLAAVRVGKKPTSPCGTLRGVDVANGVGCGPSSSRVRSIVSTPPSGAGSASS